MFIAARGGRQLLAEVDFESLSLNRRLNDVSTASLAVLADRNEDCAVILGDIEPFQYEVVAFRNYQAGDSPAWAGPIILPSWDPFGLSIGARDLFTWFERRALPFDRSFASTDLADIFGLYVTDALVRDPSPNISLLFLGEIGTPGQRSVTAASSTVAADALRELGRSGVDFTVVGRTLRFGGTPVTTATTILYEGAVVQEAGGSSPKFTKQGLNMATQVTLKGGQDAAGNQLVATVGDTDGTHGLVSLTASEPLILDQLSLTRAAAGRLGFLNPAPLYLNCALTPQAPIRFDELIPGIRIDAAFALGLTDVEGAFRLREVAVSVDSSGTETVALTLVPLSV